MRWRPEIVYNTAVSVVFSLPQRFWRPREGTAFGDEDESAAGVPEAYVVRYDQLCAVTLRFTDAEYSSVMTAMAWIQQNKGSGFTFFFDQDDSDTDYTVYLASHKVGAEMFEPRRDPADATVWELDITIRSANATRFPSAYVVD